MDGGGDDLERWAAEARAREAAGSRTHERWLRQQAAESATLAGVLLDFGERRAPVMVTTSAGRSHRADSLAVGADFVALALGPNHRLLVPLAAVVEVRPAGTGRKPMVSGDAEGQAELGATLAGVLAQAAGHRPRLSVRTPGSTVVGDLVAVGSDVLTVRVDGDPPVAAYLRLASVSEISLFASG